MTTTKQEKMQVAQEIVRQLGGPGKLRAMVGVKSYILIDLGVQFRFKSSRKVNTCRIMCDDGKDLYDFELWQITNRGCKCKYRVEGASCDMLVNLFESETGLDLSL